MRSPEHRMRSPEALEAQQSLSSHDFGEGMELKARMEIHTGSRACPMMATSDPTFT